MRRDRGRGEGKKEEKRPGAMRAPLRPRFQRPRTQLVHLLLDVQPLARVLLVAWMLSWFYPSVYPMFRACREKFSMLAGSPRGRMQYRMKVRSSGTSGDDQSRRGPRSGTYRLIIEVRDCTLLMEETHARDVIIVINCFPKAPGKIVKIEHVILWSLLMGVKMRLRRRQLDTSTFAPTCENKTWNAPEASSMMRINSLQIKRYNLYYFRSISLLRFY